MAKCRERNTSHLWTDKFCPPFVVGVLWGSAEMVHMTQHSSILTRTITNWFDRDVQGMANVGEPPGSTDLSWFQYIDSKLTCKGWQLSCAFRAIMVLSRSFGEHHIWLPPDGNFFAPLWVPVPIDEEGSESQQGVVSVVITTLRLRLFSKIFRHSISTHAHQFILPLWNTAIFKCSV